MTGENRDVPRIGNPPLHQLLSEYGVTAQWKYKYIDDVTTWKGINLALQIAAARLRKALATSLQKINERANQALRCRAGGFHQSTRVHADLPPPKMSLQSAIKVGR